MRIVFDASYCHREATGIGRGRLNLLQALLETDSGNEYLIHGWSLSLDKALLSSLRRNGVTTDLHHVPGPLKRFYWDRLRVPSLERFTGPFDLFDSSEPFAPPVRNHLVVTLHDLISFDHPEWFEASVIGRHPSLRSSLAASDAIVVPSRATYDRLQALDPALGQKAEIIHSSAGSEYAPAAEGDSDSAIIDGYRIRRPFILFVGTVEPRKNLVTLLDAFRMYSTTAKGGVTLVIAGKQGWLSGGIEQSMRRAAASGWVKVLGFVPQAVLPALYRQATAFVYPSLAEGFGLPVLEALSCRTVVVTSNVPALVELCSGAALLVDPHSPEAIAEGLRLAVEDSALRSRLTAEAGVVAGRHLPQISARQTLELYRRFA